MTARQAANDLRAYRAKLERAIFRARLAAAQDVLKEAQRISSGTTTLLELARRGHPFAVRHGSPMMPLLPVNKHQGDFYRAWKVEASPHGPVAVVNDSKVAGWLDEGTRKMLARGLTPYLTKFADRALDKRLDQALEAA